MTFTSNVREGAPSARHTRGAVALAVAALAVSCASARAPGAISSDDSPDATSAAGSSEAGAASSGASADAAPAQDGGGTTPVDLLGGDAGDGAAGPGFYALNPPKQCDNQFYVPDCTPGDSSSACGGTCSAQSACESSKPDNPDIGFLCPRFMLFSDEMAQAAKDDFGADPPFNYAIAGHDIDTGGLDGDGGTTCCQCYQLVFVEPGSDPEADVNGQSSQGSAIPIPKPLIVQSFNTAAGGGKNFDIFMGAGGFGANNACAPNFTPVSQSGEYMYTEFPPDGEPNGGGEKIIVVPDAGCETNENLVTTATLSSPACQARAASACSEVASGSATLTSETIQSCQQSNAPDSYYHLNWSEYAERIECPEHLTEVTGCKLAPQGLPAADPTVTTAAQAAADSSFRAGYTTTTMQDCCKPTCAWQDDVTGEGETAIGEYNSFYTCDQNGVPVTE